MVINNFSENYRSLSLKQNGRIALIAVTGDLRSGIDKPVSLHTLI